MAFLATQDRRAAFRDFVEDLMRSPHPEIAGKTEEIAVTKWDLWDRLVEIDRMLSAAPEKISGLSAVTEGDSRLKSVSELKAQSRTFTEALKTDFDQKAGDLIAPARDRLMAVVVRQREIAKDRLVANEDQGDLMDTPRPKKVSDGLR